MWPQDGMAALQTNTAFVDPRSQGARAVLDHLAALGARTEGYGRPCLDRKRSS